MSAVYNATVQGFYLSYYGRPADPAGLTFWTGQLAAAGGNLSSILNAFGTSAEATRRYGTGTDTSKIEAIYQQTFGRAADATGLAFYQTELAAGRITLIDISKRIIDGATGDDVTIRTNRLSAAQTFTDRLDTAAEQAGYSGSGAEDAARSWITTVTKDAATVTAAVATVDSTITSLLPVTFALTSSADTWTGGSGNDTASGKNSNLGGTLQATDKLDGGAGTDTLNLTTDIDFTGFTTGFVKNIETVSITNTGSSSRDFNMTGVTDVKTISVDATKGAVTVTAMPTGVTALKMTGQSGDTGATTTSTTYVAGASEISATTTTLAVDATNVGSSSTKRVAATLNSVEIVNLSVSGTNNLDFGGTGLTTLSISGSGTLNSTGASSLTSVDGSAATGALTLNLSGVTGAGTLTSVKTGSGADTLTLAVEDLKANATISTGAETDSLTLTNAGTTSVTTAYVVSGLETINVTNVANGGHLTLAMSNVGSETKTVSVKGGTTGHTQASVTLAGAGSRDMTFNILGSTVAAADLITDNTGTATINFKADGATASTAAAAPLGDVTVSNASSVTINAEAFTDVATAITAAGTPDVLISAPKATSVTLNVATGLSTGGAELTEFGGRITASEATSFTVIGTGKLDATQLSVAKATSGTISNGGTAGSLRLDTGATTKLTSLTITSGEAFTLLAEQAGGTTDRDLSKLQNLTINANKGLVKIDNDAGSSNLVGLNTVTLSGSGTGSAVKLGAIGATTNAYDLTVTASGTLKGSTSNHGVELGAITVTKGNSVSLDLASVQGSVNIGQIASSTDTAGNVTIKAGAAGTSSGLTAGFTVGNVAATGAVDINASGARSTSIGTVAGDTVKINTANVTNANYTLGAITAKSSVDLTLNELGAANTNVSITAASDSTGLSIAVKGGVLQEDLKITATGANVASVTLTGDLSAGADTVTIDAGGSKAKTISLAGLTDYASSDITGSTAADTITGGSGADVIRAGGGADTLTGGAGADRFFVTKGNSPYTAPVKINDLGSTDAIAYGTAAMTAAATDTTGASVATGAGGITGAVGTVAISAAKVATFTGTSTGYDSLAKKVGLLSATPNLSADGAYVLFGDSGNTYMFISGGTAGGTSDDTVIQLVGIALPNTEATLTAGTGAGSGLSGLGS